MTHPAGLLGRIALDAAGLMRTHPPRWQHPKKQALFDHVCPAGSVHAGTITVARWAEQALPMAARWSERPLDGELRADVFQYTPRAAGRVGLDWHLNFAHSSLFLAYGGPLLAQDELQCVEHPVLGAVRECLREQTDPGLQPLTREQERATPVLLCGVERRCVLDTSALYGNAFARASVAAIVAATRVLRPPTISNILAMEAPIGGSGYYASSQIEDVLRTAYTGFAATIAETRAATGTNDPEVVIHTGHWGTGAYGGHRVLMAMLQIVAARLAGVSRLVFHTVDERGLAPVHAALEKLGPLATLNLGATIRAIDAMRFMWGAPNGT